MNILKANIVRIVLMAVIVLSVGFVIYQITRPQKTLAQQMADQPPRFTFLVRCEPISLGFFINPYNLQSTGEAKPGKDARKYTLACKLPIGVEIVPLYEKMQNSIPLPKPGEVHTFTLYENAVVSMVDIPASAARLRTPIDSEGMMVIPVSLWPWASENVLNLVCFEEISKSTQQPEHACWLH